MAKKRNIGSQELKRRNGHVIRKRNSQRPETNFHNKETKKNHEGVGFVLNSAFLGWPHHKVPAACGDAAYRICRVTMSIPAPPAPGFFISVRLGPY
jgi:hypothetical protein